MQFSRNAARPDRRALLLGALALACGAPLAYAQSEDFQGFVQGLWPAAQAAGVTREVFDEAARGLVPEPAVLKKPAAQSEFTVSIPAYVAGAATTARVARGRASPRELTHILSNSNSAMACPAKSSWRF